jgi:hypothetical protein
VILLVEEVGDMIVDIDVTDVTQEDVNKTDLKMRELQVGVKSYH